MTDVDEPQKRYLSEILEDTKFISSEKSWKPGIRQGLTEEENEGTFWGNGNVMYLNRRFLLHRFMHLSKLTDSTLRICEFHYM